MSKRLTVIHLILIVLGLTACVRSSSGGDARLPQPSGKSPTASYTQTVDNNSPPGPTKTLALTKTPAQGLSPSVMAPTQPNPAIGPTPDAGALPAEVMQTLAIMPLVAGSSWVYSDDAYSQDEKVTWRISETVIDNQVKPPYFAAKIQRDVALISGNPSSSFINPPRSGLYWYLVDGSRVYRQDVDQAGELSWNRLDDLTLVFVFPLSSKAGCWYPDPGQRRAAPVPGAPGCRQGGDGASLKVPAGTLDACHTVLSPDNTGINKLTFCDGVGIAETSFDHQGTRYGEHLLLTGYLVQTP